MAAPEFGVTDWGEEWLHTVEPGNRLPNPQLPKARSLARNEKVDLNLDGNEIGAVVDDGGEGQFVSGSVPPWSARERKRAESVVARHEPAVAGDLSDDLLAELNRAGVPVAAELDELEMECDCSTRRRPCAHILATLYTLVQAVDERPVVALELRGEAGTVAQPEAGDWIPLSALDPERFYGS